MKAGMRLLLVILTSIYSVQMEMYAQESVSSQKITFEDAWIITNTNSHVVKQINYQRQEKNQALNSARGLFFPKIGITASYMKMSQDLTLDLTPIKETLIKVVSPMAMYGNFSGVPNPDPASNQVVPILPDNVSTQAVRKSLSDGLTAIENSNWNQMIQKKQFGVVAATFQWPVFVGGKINIANNVARIECNEVDEVASQKQGELLSELVERYFGLCLAKKAVNVRNDVYRGMEKHLQDAEKMEKEGLIATADVLHAHVYFSQAARELTRANRMAEILNQSLINTLVLTEGTFIDPVSELFYLDSVPSLVYFKNMAITQNPLLKQVATKKLLSVQKIKAEQAEYFPEIALQGMVNLTDKDLSVYTPKWVAGIGLKWTLFDGTARSRKVSQALLKSEQVDEIKLKAESDITAMIDKLYNELNMYKEQLNELESARTYAEEYLRVREKAFKEEMSNATEVVDANLALAQVRIERLQAMYGYDLTLARLCQYSGIPQEFQVYRQQAGVKNENSNLVEK